MITRSRCHNSSHNGTDVHRWPLRHEIWVKLLLCECGWASLSGSIFHCSTSWIMPWIRLVSIVVGLDQEPCYIIQLIWSMDAVAISLNNSPLVALRTANHEVYWCTNSGWFKSLEGILIVGLLGEDPSQKPNVWHSVVHQNIDDLADLGLGVAGVYIDGKSSISNTS